MEKSNEWKYVSTDATLKVCKHERDSAPFGDDEALRRLLTVRGRTGGVLLMKPTLSETSELIAQAFQTDFSPLAASSIAEHGVYRHRLAIFEVLFGDEGSVHQSFVYVFGCNPSSNRVWVRPVEKTNTRIQMSETSSSQDPDGRSSHAPRHIRRHVRWQQRETAIHIRGQNPQ